MIINFKYCLDITHHFKWFNEEKTFAMYYYEEFKSKITMNGFFFHKIKEKVNCVLEASIKKGYLFLAIERYSNSKLEEYLKVWKKISKRYNLENFSDFREQEYVQDGRKFFIGMATFDNNSFETALAIQNDNMHNCYMLLKTDDLEYEIEEEKSLMCLLEFDEQKRFSMIFNNFCKKKMIAVRMGSGGEDIEYDFVFTSVDANL